MRFPKWLDCSSEASVVLVIVIIMALAALVFAYERSRSELFSEGIRIELEAVNDGYPTPND